MSRWVEFPCVPRSIAIGHRTFRHCPYWQRLCIKAADRQFFEVAVLVEGCWSTSDCFRLGVLPMDPEIRADVFWSHVRHTSGCVRPAPRRSMAHRCCGSDGDPAAATQCQAMRKWSIACRLEKEGSFFKVVRKCPNVVLALHLDDLEVDIAPQQHQIDRGNGCSLKFCVWEHLTSYSLCAFALEVGVR